MRKTITIITTLGLVAAAGCATQGPRPVEQLVRARTLVEATEKDGNAQKYAPADLQAAHDELANAGRADAAGRFDEARAFAESAAADANLAAARGAAGDAERGAHEVQASNESVRREAARAGDAADNAPPAPLPPPSPQP